MNVSVIIPTLNAARFLPELFEGLRAQGVPGLELLVVDSSSEDGTAGLARSLGARVLTVGRDEFDHGGTRTGAGLLARGDILIYMTQDCRMAGPDSMGLLLEPFREGGAVGASYGRQLPAPGAGPFAAHLRDFNYPPEPHVRRPADRERLGLRAAFISNSFAAWNRRALEDIGWFREGLILGEDMQAGARLLLGGYEVHYAAAARVYHSHDYSALEELRRYFDIGVLHACEAWLLRGFGRAEGEGRRYIMDGLSYLWGHGRGRLVPAFLLRGGLKLAGYRLGLAHRRLPRGLARRLSMNRKWWDRAGAGR